MHRVTLRRRRAYLRALKQKKGEPLGGAIFDQNDQYWYQNNRFMILQGLVGVAKPYRKYFRFSAKDHFSIYHFFGSGPQKQFLCNQSLTYGRQNHLIVTTDWQNFQVFANLKSTFSGCTNSAIRRMKKLAVATA